MNQNTLATMSNIAILPSPIGVVAVAVAGGRVAAVSIGNRDWKQAERAIANVLSRYDYGRTGVANSERGRSLRQSVSADDAAAQIARYAEGEPVDLQQLPVIEDHLTPFQRRVAAACRAIRFGETRTYGELAQRAGRPGAARAVGQVMAANRVPLLTPCHRVVASSGRLGGFSAPQGVAFKRRLLELEQQAASLFA